MSDRPARARVALHVLSLVATAFIAGEIWREQHNTLHDNGRWVSTKVGLDKGVIGGIATVTTRTALHRNHLNLGSWHGFQEFLCHEPLDLRELEFDFELSTDSWIALRLDDGERVHGLRFSRQAGFPSMIFTATPEGEFTDRRELELEIEDAGWRRARIERSADGKISFRLDGSELGELAGPEGVLTLGFRGSFAEGWVDRIRARGPASELLIDEDFASERGRALPCALFLAGFTALHAAILVLSRRRGRGSGARRWLLSSRISLATLALSGLLFGVIYRWRAGRYPDDIDFKNYPARIEFEDEILPQLRERYAESPPADVTRILFIGSSQTWGAGVSEARETYVRRIEDALNELPGEGRYECINTGISGARVARLFEIFESEWSLWQPALVVIDLSYNDRNISEDFPAGVREFVERVRSIGAEVLLITEPAAPGFEHEGLRENHESLRAIASDAQVALVDMQRVLDEQADAGFLWWDSVHLTSLGHRLFTESLMPEIRRLAEAE